MTKKLFNKWIKTLTKAENKNKEMLKSKEIAPAIYSLLNKVNSDKYESIITQYNHKLS